jgi:hypothetical protein
MYKNILIICGLIILYIIFKYTKKSETKYNTQIISQINTNHDIDFTKKFNKYDNYIYFRGLIPTSFYQYDNHEIGGSKYFMNTILYNNDSNTNNINYNKYSSYRIKPNILNNIKNTKKKNHKCNKTENANLFNLYK